MTVTENDQIRLLKVIQKRMIFVCKIMIVNEIVSVVLPPSIVLYTPKKQYMFPFSQPKFSCYFYENLDKIYQEIPRFPPFILPFTPLIFAF